MPAHTLSTRNERAIVVYYSSDIITANRILLYLYSLKLEEGHYPVSQDKYYNYFLPKYFKDSEYFKRKTHYTFIKENNKEYAILYYPITSGILKEYGPIKIAIDECGKYAPGKSGKRLKLKGWWIFSKIEQEPFEKGFLIK